MSETRRSTSQRAFREAIEPYASAQPTASFVKLSISLPADLVDVVRSAAAESGTTVSATIAAALRRTLEDSEQRRLDAALSLDAEENVAWAEAAASEHAKLLAELEW
jgi:metal-responsive CopG/Arc/MetJ family transcriptional regulator